MLIALPVYPVTYTIENLSYRTRRGILLLLMRLFLRRYILVRSCISVLKFNCAKTIDTTSIHMKNVVTDIPVTALGREESLTVSKCQSNHFMFFYKKGHLAWKLSNLSLKPGCHCYRRRGSLWHDYAMILRSCAVYTEIRFIIWRSC